MTSDAEITQALSGANYVKDRLLSLISVGPFNIQSSYYAVKCRVKAEESLRKKIEYKKNIEGKKKYSAKDVTDVVGLRILTIFSETLLQATYDFLDFITLCQSPQISLCPGDKLDDAIEEIVIYKYKGYNSAYDMVESALVSQPFTINSSGAKKLQSRESSPRQPYSSIHIVCWFLSYHAGAPLRVPVEVQIRTIFEDAWNEVDHPLRYKGLRLEQPTGEERKQSEAFSKRLSDLKRQLEFCSDHADSIRSDYALYQNAQRINTNASAETISIKLTDHFNLKSSTILSDADFKQKYDPIEQKVFSGRYNPVNIVDADASGLIDELENLGSDLTALVDDYRIKSPEQFSLDSDLAYFVGIVRGLIKIRRAHCQRAVRRRDGIVAQTDARDGLAEYFALEKADEFKTDSYLKFRLANDFYAMGHVDAAYEKCVEAEEVLRADARVRSDGFVPVLIFRRLAFIAWRKKEAIRKEGEAIGIMNYRPARQHELLKVATEKALHAATLMRSCRILPSAAANAATLELARDCNNFASFAWEFMDLFGRAALASCEGLQTADFEQIAKAIFDGYGEADLAVSQLDTVCKCYALAGKWEQSSHYLERLSSAVASVQKQGIGQDLLQRINYSVNRLAEYIDAKGHV